MKINIQWTNRTRNEPTFRRHPGPDGRYSPPGHEDNPGS